ncbi:MAG: hypothetical protein WBB47_07465 [Paenisporosarcina sp.]
MIETVIDDFIIISFIGCHVEEDDMKSDIEIKGTITEIDGKGNRNLVKDRHGINMDYISRGWK